MNISYFVFNKIANQRAELKAMSLKMKQDTENERKELSSIGLETSCKIQDLRKKSQYSVLSELSSSQKTSIQPPNDIIKDFYSSSNPNNNDTNNDANTTGSKNAKKSIKIDETQNITKEFHKQMTYTLSIAGVKAFTGSNKTQDGT